MNASELRHRLKAWKPPEIPAGAKPRGLSGRRFPEAAKSVKGGGFRTGYRDE